MVGNAFDFGMTTTVRLTNRIEVDDDGHMKYQLDVDYGRGLFPKNLLLVSPRGEVRRSYLSLLSSPEAKLVLSQRAIKTGQVDCGWRVWVD